CGKCTPCREGTYWLERVLQRILDGRGQESDIKLLESIATQMQGETLCALGEFATSPVLSTIKHFPEDYRAKINGASSPIGRNEAKMAEVVVAAAEVKAG
ncbi:MAG TPA: hypothetical protein DEP47_02930, partial [Chloroflexi bacterium]|nr:hypothetical protein [Chloroflexota bacterium]